MLLQNAPAYRNGTQTVELCRGEFVYKDTEFKIVDLPGIYSTNPVSKDEKCAVEYLKNEHIDVVSCCP